MLSNNTGIPIPMTRILGSIPSGHWRPDCQRNTRCFGNLAGRFYDTYMRPTAPELCSSQSTLTNTNMPVQTNESTGPVWVTRSGEQSPNGSSVVSISRSARRQYTNVISSSASIDNGSSLHRARSTLTGSLVPTRRLAM